MSSDLHWCPFGCGKCVQWFRRGHDGCHFWCLRCGVMIPRERV